MPGDGRDGVPQGPRDEPVRLPELRLPSTGRRAHKASPLLRRRPLGDTSLPIGSGRSAPLPRRAALHRAAQSGEGENRARRRGDARRRQCRRRRSRGRGAGLRLHGRLARHGGGRGHHRRRRSRGRAAPALRPLRRLRRRAHAGGYPLADAIAAHHDCHRRRQGRRTSLYRRAHQPDDGRRHGFLRDARRRAARRARRSDRLRRARASSSRRSARSCRKASSAPNTFTSTAWSTASCIATSCARRCRGSAG